MSAPANTTTRPPQWPGVTIKVTPVTAVPREAFEPQVLDARSARERRIVFVRTGPPER